MEWVSGNVFIRPTKFSRVGEVVEGHKHHFDHTTIVFKGGIHVHATLPNGTVIERDFTAPAHFLVKKDVIHEITALTDDAEFWCIYSHRNAQGDVVQEWDGWHTATTAAYD
jgi:hypothetical protein